MKPQFWKTKTLKAMTRNEWESLCDGCGICCLEKIEDKNTGEVRLLSIGCQFLDITDCRCLIYDCRLIVNSDCISLTPYKIKRITWLPETCAYRLIAEGRDLKWWHPLVSGDPNTVHDAGISVRDKIVSGRYIHPDDMTPFP